VLALGLVMGIAAVRTKGISFVIITLALGQVLWGLAFQWVSLSEGDNGIPLASLPSLGPFDLNDPLTLRMTVLVVFAVVALLLVTIVHSPFGLSLRGVRSNETRLAALGYRTGLHRYLAWVIAVFFTGVAGVLYIFVNQLISPATMAFSEDGLLVIMVVLGGLGSIWGPALGAVVIVLFQQELSIYVTRWQTLMGLTLIAVVLFSPGGLWGVVRAAGRRRDALIAKLEARQAGHGGPAGAGQGDAP
jgi:branched-chain amino acid transport system permease protein